MKFVFGLLVVVVVLAAACSGGDGKTDTPTVPPESPTSAAETATAIPATPTPAALFDAKDLKAGPPVKLPAGLVLYTRDGVWEGAGGDLTRHYIDASGSLRSQDLIVSRHGKEDPFALMRAFPDGAGGLWAQMCHGSCYGQPDPITTQVSLDGGISWTAAFEAEQSNRWIVAVDSDSLIVGQSLPGGRVDLFRLSRSNGESSLLPVPPTVSDGANIFAGYASDGIVLAAADNDGKTIWDLATGDALAKVPVPNPFQSIRVVGFKPESEGRELYVAWYGPGDSRARDWYLGTLDVASGDFTQVLSGSLAEGVGMVYALHWLSDTLAIGRASFDAADYVPGSGTWISDTVALIDLAAGTVRPVEGFVEQIGAKSGGPLPIRVDIGKFVRVSTGGDCLNVRPEPKVSSAALACYIDGVLLKVRAESADGWLPVSTPDGRDGWASTEFLEAFP